MKVRQLVKRLFNLHVFPSREWQRIQEEPVYDSQDILRDYALPVIFTVVFFRLALYGGRYEMSLKAVSFAMIAFVLLMLTLFIVSSFIYSLSPRFVSTLDRLSASKLSVYGLSPLWMSFFIGGMTPFGPLQGYHHLVGILYSLGIMVQGLPAVMNTPPEARRQFSFALIILLGLMQAILISLLAGASRALLPHPM